MKKKIHVFLVLKLYARKYIEDANVQYANAMLQTYLPSRFAAKHLRLPNTRLRLNNYNYTDYEAVVRPV